MTTICENTITSGFNFALGRFLFDLTIFGGVIGFLLFVLVVVTFWPRKK